MTILRYFFIATAALVFIFSVQIIVYEIRSPIADKVNPNWEERIRDSKVCEHSDGGTDAALARAFNRSIL